VTPALAFIALEKFSPEPSRIRLPLFPTGVMNVTTAKYKRPKEKPFMATFTIDADNNITAHAGLPVGADESQSFSNAKELAKFTAECPHPAWWKPGIASRAWRPLTI
jgi:hypothetical protein